MERNSEKNVLPRKTKDLRLRNLQWRWLLFLAETQKTETEPGCLGESIISADVLLTSESTYLTPREPRDVTRVLTTASFVNICKVVVILIPTFRNWGIPWQLFRACLCTGISVSALCAFRKGVFLGSSDFKVYKAQWVFIWLFCIQPIPRRCSTFRINM